MIQRADKKVERRPLDEDFPYRCRGKGCDNRLPARTKSITETTESGIEMVVDTVDIPRLYKREQFCQDCLLVYAVGRQMRHRKSIHQGKVVTRRSAWSAALGWIAEQKEKAEARRAKKQAPVEAAA